MYKVDGNWWLVAWGRTMSGSMCSRFLDSFFAAVCILTISPFLLFIVFLIRGLGQDPIFRQVRVGFNEKPFTIYKFRTIPRNGWEGIEAESGRLRAVLYTSVVTSLRRTGLDELPQLFNILVGDMRFIGPRPLTLEDYELLPEIRRLRSLCHPGITGLAQVNGGQALDPVSKVVLDVYQQHFFDIRMLFLVLFRSIARVLGFTSVISKPCPKLLNKAKLSVLEKLHTIDQVDRTRISRAVAQCSGDVCGQTT